MNQSRQLFTLLAAAALLMSPISSLADTVETLVQFDPTLSENPESIVIDRDQNLYITMAFTGEVRKIAPDLTQSTLAMMPIGAPCAGVLPPVAALGLALDRREQLYVAVSACDPANNGIWKVDKDDGTIELLANAPSHTVLNGLAVHRGYVYAADTFGAQVWRVRKTGGFLELWAADPLLEIPPGVPFPGPNGIRAFRNKIYVAVSATGNIVRFPLVGSGAAGEPSVHATLPGGQGCDEFTFDWRARIYCTTDPFNTVVRLNRDGSSDILLTGADGLDGPTSVAFGRGPGEWRKLYITNAAFPFFTETFTPSLMRLTFDVP